MGKKNTNFGNLGSIGTKFKLIPKTKNEPNKTNLREFVVFDEEQFNSSSPNIQDGNKQKKLIRLNDSPPLPDIKPNPQYQQEKTDKNFYNSTKNPKNDPQKVPNQSKPATTIEKPIQFKKKDSVMVESIENFNQNEPESKQLTDDEEAPVLISSNLPNAPLAMKSMKRMKKKEKTGENCRKMQKKRGQNNENIEE